MEREKKNRTQINTDSPAGEQVSTDSENKIKKSNSIKSPILRGVRI